MFASLDSISEDGGVVNRIQLMIDAALSIELLAHYSIIDEAAASRGFDRNSIAVFSQRSRHALPLVSIELLAHYSITDEAAASRGFASQVRRNFACSFVDNLR